MRVEDCKNKNNNYHEIDIYEIGQVIQLNGHNWTIYEIYEGNKKRYDCITKMGDTVQHRMYDCLELRKGILL